MTQATTQSEWLVTDGAPPTEGDLRDVAQALDTDADGATRGAGDGMRMAALLHDVVIHDVRRWWGGADIRIDALVVHGPPPDAGATAAPAYVPGTFRFPDVHDGDRLPIDDNGLLIFAGTPSWFLDVFILASRDTADSDNLGALLSKAIGSAGLQQAVGGVLALTAAAPAVAAVTAGLAASAVLGDLAYKVVRAVSSETVGPYRGSFLQLRDAYGLGRHPVEASAEGGSFRVRDLSFWFEVVAEGE